MTAGVVMVEQKRKGLLPFDHFGDLKVGDIITERLYTCPNGLQLGARRGGRLHLADEHTWEAFVLDERGIVVGESVGWVTEAELERLVDALANWWGNRSEANDRRNVLVSA